MSDKPQSNVPTPADFFGWIGQFMQPITEAGTRLTPAVPVPSGSDPLAMWKSLTEYNQQAWSQFLKQVVSTPEFAAGLGRTTSNQAVVRESVRKAAKAYLEAANMPSRDDHIRLASQVVALDAKVDDVEEMLKDAELAGVNRRLDTLISRLDHLEKQAAKTGNHQNSSSLEKKLDELNAKLDRLSSLENRLTKIEAALAPKSKSAPARKTSAVPATTKTSASQAAKKPGKVPAAPTE